MSSSADTKRIGIPAVAVLIVVAVAFGWVGSNFLGGGSGGAASADGGTTEKMYSCGMHPNVFQKGPGLCPICEMNLTPMKTGDDESGPSNERRILYWRAPMDPNFISDKPGMSPMGMELVPVYGEESAPATGHVIRIDPVTIQNMGIRTVVLRRGPLVKTIRTIGRVDYDEQRVMFINTKFEGWIEKLHVNETGQQVEKGQPLFDVYSRELYTAQEEYQAAHRAVGRLADSTLPSAKEEALRMLEAAVTKLRYLDVSDEQIAELSGTDEIQKNMTINSPSRGVVTEKMVLQGMFVKPGMRLYTIADLSRVWVYVDIYEYQLPWVRVGQQAKMRLTYIPGKEFEGQVVYIYPYLEKKTRVVKMRLEFDNPTMELKPDMFANVTLFAELNRDALLIPREAYIDSGIRQVAFVALDGGKFQPREILVGVEAENGMVEVLYGLDAGEVVVTSGQFLLDSESNLKASLAKMIEAERALTTKHPPELGAGEHAHAAQGIPDDARYACPMETHPDETEPQEQGAYFSPDEGKCPACGMKYKPLDELAWVKARRAAAGAEVAYTCTDHPHVYAKSAEPCPRCGKDMSAFKVMYTCPDAGHSGVISLVSSNCPRDGQGLAPFRGLWLDEAMAVANLPPNPGLAEAAEFHCPVHPLVHSTAPAHCTICGAPLESKSAAAQLVQIPAGAKYTCSMKECNFFSAESGRCDVCGMKLKPLDELDWVKDLKRGEAQAATVQYVCPMHPDEQADHPRTCTKCGMQLVPVDSLVQPQTAPAKVAAQMDFITEHYLELSRLLASDTTGGVPLNALGIASAAEELSKQLQDPGVELPAEVTVAAERLRSAALKTTGQDIQADRVTFVELGAAMRTLIQHIRPDKKRWPKLYIYHCPMSKGDWIQSVEQKANPFYGFKMLRCGELQATK